MKVSLLGSIVLLMTMVAGPAGAESRYGPPYEHPHGEAPQQCSGDPDSECWSNAQADASGGLGVAASVTSPASGFAPGFAGVHANANVDVLHDVPEETRAVRGVVILNVTEARVWHTCPIICPLGDGMAQIKVFVDGDPQACGWNCAKRYEHPLLDITDGPTDPIVGSRVEIPFELVRDQNPYGKIPAGPMWVTVWIDVQVDLRPPLGKLPHDHAQVGTVGATFDGLLEAVVVY